MQSNCSTFVIAEAGVNHNGDLNLAKQLIDTAADSGADAVKFQSFHADELVGRATHKAEYQARATGSAESQLDMLRSLELSEVGHFELAQYAQEKQIRFLSTPFDVASLELLTGRLGLTTIKIPSGEITNAPFLLAIARAANDVILSTGMSTTDEIQAALSVLAFGFSERATVVIPAASDLRLAFSSAQERGFLRDRVTLLHCTSEYPAATAEVNLRAMATMSRQFGLPVGYSDHTAGIHVALAAVALGAVVIEKHFTIDRGLPGPDHMASVEPDELKILVDQIRDIEQSLGDGIKRPTESELKNRGVARRSLVVSRDVAKGEQFSEDNLTCKRVGEGTSPFEYWNLLGKTARRFYRTDESVDA